MTLVPYEGETRAPFLQPAGALPQAPQNRDNPTGLGFLVRGATIGLSPLVELEEDERNIWEAGLRQESALAMLFNAASRPQFEPDPEFNIGTRLNELQGVNFDPVIMAQAMSDDEFDYLAARARQEQNDRDLLMRSGAAGVIAGMAGGTISPTILLPGGAVFRGVRSGAQLARMAGSGAGWAMAGATIDEGLLYLDQHQRTPQDVMLGIGTAGVLGSVFGSGAYMLSAGALRRFEADMAAGETQEAIAILTPRTNEDPPERAAGAQVASINDEVDPGGTYFVGLDRVLSFMSPVTRTLNQNVSATARRMQAQLGTGGLYTEATARGDVIAAAGDIETRRNRWFTGMYDVMQTQHMSWNNYVTRTPVAERMNQREFFEEVGRALENGTTHAIPEIQELAESYRRSVFLPILEEGMRPDVNLFPQIDLDEAMSYMPRMVNKNLAREDRLALREIFTEHFEGQSREKAERLLATARRMQERDVQTLEDLALDPAEMFELRGRLEQEMNELPEQFPPSIKEVAREIRDLRAEARGRRDAEAKQLRAEAERLEKENKELLKPFRTSERALKARFNTLNQTRAGLELRQRRTLNRINDIEEAQINAIERAGEALARLRERVARGEENLDKALASAKEKLERAYKVWERAEKRLDKLRETPEGFAELEMSDVRPTDRISVIEAQQQTRAQKLDDLMEGLNELEEADSRNELLAAIDAQKERTLRRVVETNHRRAVRAQNLENRIASQDPMVNAKLQKEIADRIATREQKALDNIRQRLGGEYKLRLKEGTDEVIPYTLSDAELADFSLSARADAERLIERLSSGGQYMPAMIKVGERGSQLARTLNIDPQKVWSNGRRYEEFLERNIEKVSRNYMRQMAADLEIKRAFGSVNPLADDELMAGKIRAELYERLEEIQADESLTPKQKANASRKANKEFEQLKEDLAVQIERLRYHRGVPDNPEAFGYRAGRFAMNLNVLRFMGGVVGQSVPDIANVVMKAGTMQNFGKAFQALTTDYQNFRASSNEVKYAGVAMDLIAHGRMSAMFDVTDEVEHGFMLERGVQWATNKFGLVSGMDHWNTWTKHFSAVVTNFRLISGIDQLVNGGISRSERAYLAANGIDLGTARMMWEEMTTTPGGGNKIDGVWVPNTIDWQNEELAVRYRTAVGRMVNSMIVTPGIERPNMVDANMWARLAFQFRSFTLSSTQRIVLASMQEARLGNYVPLLVGSMMSIGLGAMAYGIYALQKPEERRNELLNASSDRWLNEAINRSGLLGVLGEVKAIGEQIPATRSVATLGSEVPGNSVFANVSGRLAGPTAGLVQDTLDITLPQLTDMLAQRDAAAWTEREQNALRRLLPYQNLHALGVGFNMLQDAAR